MIECWLRLVVHENDRTNDNSYHEANDNHHHAIATAARMRRVLLATARFSLRLLLLDPPLLVIGLARLEPCAAQHMHSRHKNAVEGERAPQTSARAPPLRSGHAVVMPTGQRRLRILHGLAPRSTESAAPATAIARINCCRRPAR